MMCMYSKKHILGLGLVGLLSGLLSFWILRQFYVLEIIPGLVFGFMIGAYYFVIENKGIFESVYKFGLFLIASTLSYVVAYGVVLMTGAFLWIFSTVLAGAVGTAILLYFFKKIGYPFRAEDFRYLVCGGAILGVSYWFGNNLSFFEEKGPSSMWNNLFVLLPIWQAGMAALLGWTTCHVAAKGK